jgi:alcohol dehydrogenase
MTPIPTGRLSRRAAAGRTGTRCHVPCSRAEEQWIRNVTITTGLVDAYSTPVLLRLLTTHQIDAGRFITHHFGLDGFAEAYEVFGNAADTGALKVVLTR